MSDDRPPPDGATELPASLLEGRYRVERTLGEGAFGRVYRAFDTRLRHTVAIKELLAARHATDPAVYARYLDRFGREARAARWTQHPNIVTVYDLAIARDGNHYLVMEYVDGVNLRELLAGEGRLPVERAAAIAADVARALAAVHAQDIVHRDLKPANIMIGRQGTVKLMDFGVAQVGHESARSVEGEEGVARHPGTPLYMSPEQRGETEYLDGRSDLYALGTVLYEMLTGEPYGRRRLSLRALRPDVPPAMEAVVGRLLAHDPAARYARADDVARDLAALARGWPVGMADQGGAGAFAAPEAQPWPPPVAALGVPAAYGGPPSGDVPGAPQSVRGDGPGGAVVPKRRGAWLAAAGGLVAVLAALAVGALLVTRPGNAPATATAPPPTPATPTGRAATATFGVLAPTATVAAAPTPTITAAPPTVAHPTATAAPPATRPAPTPTPINTRVVYTADFSTFTVADARSASGALDPATGEYRLTVTADAQIRSASHDGITFQDFILDVDAHFVDDTVSDGTYGLAFRIQSVGPNSAYDTHYTFEISPGGYFLVRKWTAVDSYDLVQRPLFSPAIKPGTAVNHLRIICIGETILLQVNGTTVGTYTSTIPNAGSIAVVVLNPSSTTRTTASYKNLQISVPV